ncbi:hypothetical protein B0H17DRAFT_445816 [Mycena rosella]|uniref:Uncharacterized protein n=1 Tax=Mycena rosella TaxID=1033263 RepID=A0AAD7DN92_MYCRO|nr:hypothetical protein B0H17DRAFT_445816 [Mycena rosella]
MPIYGLSLTRQSCDPTKMYSEELPAEEKQPEKKARTSQNDVDSAATIFLPAEDEDHPIRADLQDALFEVTARPRYEKNNQKRRDQRQAQADIETEDLDAADPAKVAIAIKVWTSRVQKHLEIYSQVGRMLDGVRDSQLLGVAFTASSKEDGLCSNTGDADAAWANIDAPTVKWLTELAKNPLQTARDSIIVSLKWRERQMKSFRKSVTAFAPARRSLQMPLFGTWPHTRRIPHGASSSSSSSISLSTQFTSVYILY